ncbi:MAG TPA: argininosuccinate lyase [Pyrinomonadaceae bacterium]|nr:argininosuccinate lyase [Pyrinomonadaceae bacterium]
MADDKKQLWGGRFTAPPDETFAEFNDSFRFDQRLFAADVTASVAHANGLQRAGIISSEEAGSIVTGLKALLNEAGEHAAYFGTAKAEDVHSFIEAKLIEKIGDTGRKLHTGRSRNDQVATAFRLWCRDEVDAAVVLIRRVECSLVGLATRHPDAVIPAYTHLQRAQPVLFAHWCLAYFEMLERDVERFEQTRKRLNVMPLGSGAVAGTGFPIDRDAVAKELGFDKVTANSLDGVSDRDFTVDICSAASLLMVHLSRLAEDMILYASTEFGLITLSDAVSSGSSLMPQKKNPDALELLRGKAGRVFGSNFSLLTMLKGLPLAYNKDMQEDKEAVFDTIDTVNISLRAAEVILDNTSLNEAASSRAAATGYLNATDLADYLVEKGMPFRSAHEAVGKAVLFAIKKGCELNELALGDLRQFSDLIEEDVFDRLSIEASLAARSAVGGTSPERVREALAAAKAKLEK